jgi:hypothetical protein
MYLEKEFSLKNQLVISSDVSYCGLLGYDSLLSAGITYISEECASSIFNGDGLSSKMMVPTYQTTWWIN